MDIRDTIKFKKEVKTCLNCKHSTDIKVKYLNQYDDDYCNLKCLKFPEINEWINDDSLCKYHANYKERR